jgi:sorbitol-specific phosphotransferase system component IIBC
MPDLLREALRSPRDLALMLGALLVAMIVTAPLPTPLWGPAALLLAAIPGTMIMNRVHKRAEARARRDRDRERDET